MNKSIEQQLALRYAQICDDREFEKIREIIASHFTQTGPEWSCKGADEFVQQLGFLANNFSATMHMVGNQVGHWQGEVYEGETYSIASHAYEKEGVKRKMEMAIRYQERIEKIAEVFQYTCRDVEVVWTSDSPLFT